MSEYCLQCDAKIRRCERYHPEYGFTCILPGGSHEGPHFDMSGGYWTLEGGQLRDWTDGYRRGYDDGYSAGYDSGHGEGYDYASGDGS